MRHTDLKRLSLLGTLVLSLVAFMQVSYAADKDAKEPVSKDCVKEVDEWANADKKSDQEFEQMKTACLKFEQEKTPEKKAKLAETCKSEMEQLQKASDKKKDELDDIPGKCKAKK